MSTNAIARFPDAMLDIETMSLHPNNALILSIGILHFDPSPDSEPTLGARWLIKPDPRPQLLLGRNVDPDTQKFWAGQSREAKEDWVVGEVDSMLCVCDQISDATEGVKRLWARGTVFDLGNVASLLRQAGYKEPWHYQAPRDVRQIEEECPASRLPPLGRLDDVDGKPHAALYDCAVQAYTVWQHWPQAQHIAHHSV